MEPNIKKRGKTYHVDFVFKGKRIRKSLKTANPDEADRRAKALVSNLSKSEPIKTPRLIKTRIGTIVDYCLD